MSFLKVSTQFLMYLQDEGWPNHCTDAILPEFKACLNWLFQSHFFNASAIVGYLIIEVHYPLMFPNSVQLLYCFIFLEPSQNQFFYDGAVTFSHRFFKWYSLARLTWMLRWDANS